MWTTRYIGSRVKYLVLPLAFAAAFGARAEAQTIGSFATGGSFNYDGLTFTISNCSGPSGNAGNCGAVELKALSQSRGSVAVQVLGNGGAYGGNALQTAAGSSTNLTTSFALSVASQGTAQVTGVSAAVTSVNSTPISLASLPFYTNASGCAIASGSKYPGTVYPNYSGTCEPYAGLNQPASLSFTATGNLSIDVNLSVNASSNADSLTTATFTFSKIPEPGSIATMASGLLFLGFLHSRRRNGKRAKRNTN
jgi:hypothetical protein